jgi:hypothetical protein
MSLKEELPIRLEQISQEIKLKKYWPSNLAEDLLKKFQSSKERDIIFPKLGDLAKSSNDEKISNYYNLWKTDYKKKKNKKKKMDCPYDE